jgi:hypothetical protein
VRGMSGEPLRVVKVGTVAAIVGESRRSPAPTRERLARYDAVIRLIAEHTSAVLPARFGTCFPDADELIFILRTRQVSLRRALRHVRGRVQMTVRVIGGKSQIPNPKSQIPTPEARSPKPGATTSGADYLRARAAAAAREREIPGFEPVRAAVMRWVRDERVEKRDRIATVYHLVTRRGAAAYAPAAQDSAAAAGLRVLITGPFPPYAFTEI